jgi:phenylacetate-CoA ligase
MADFFVRLDGSLVAGVSLVERTLTAFPGISQLQIVQERLGEMTLNVVPDHEYGLATEEGLIREIRSVFEPETTVIVAMLTAIPQERNGKYRFAICRVPHLGHPSPSFPTTATESNHEVTKR